MRRTLGQTYGRKFDRDFESNWAAYLYPSLNYFGVYNCSEAIIGIGDINTPMDELFRNLRVSKEKCLRSCPLVEGCYW